MQTTLHEEQDHRLDSVPRAAKEEKLRSTPQAFPLPKRGPVNRKLHKARNTYIQDTHDHGIEIVLDAEGKLLCCKAN